MTTIPDYPLHTEPQDPQNELSGWIVTNPMNQRRARLRLLFFLYRLLSEQSGETLPDIPVSMLRSIIKKRPSLLGGRMSSKLAFIGGRYFWDPDIPGFPASAFQRRMKSEIARHSLRNDEGEGIEGLRLSLTARCPMRYKSAPGRIFSAQADMLSREELIRIVRLYQDFGTTKITFCGGEALLRLEDIYAILEAASPVTDFWIDTTGFSLTDDKARKLKMLGLTGLSIRLNHYNASSCNNFRDHPEAFDWVVRAAVAAHRAELVSSLTFYALPSFTNVHDLEQYFNLARKLGVAFVEIMEPDSRKEEASLSEEQRELLQTASLLYNSDPAYADYPIIIYRPCRTGENGTEDNRPRDIHIDAAGGIHTRRFDEKTIGHIDDFPPDLSLQLVEAWKGA